MRRRSRLVRLIHRACLQDFSCRTWTCWLASSCRANWRMSGRLPSRASLPASLLVVRDRAVMTCTKARLRALPRSLASRSRSVCRRMSTRWWLCPCGDSPRCSSHLWSWSMLAWLRRAIVSANRASPGSVRCSLVSDRPPSSGAGGGPCAAGTTRRSDRWPRVHGTSGLRSRPQAMPPRSTIRSDEAPSPPLPSAREEPPNRVRSRSRKVSAQRPMA